MLIDLLKGDPQMSAETDVCVIGAGAAGLTVARDLHQAGHDVCLLEAGGLDFDSATQSLYAGRNLGQAYYPLDQARLRFFGGTTNIWGGRCVPLDRIDFERRHWVPHSGWPISRDDLEPWYRLAHDDLELGEFDYSAALWESVGIKPEPIAAQELTSAFWRFDVQQERFNSNRCGDLVAASNVRIFLNANLTRIQAAETGRSILTVQAKSLRGHTLTVHARHFVLACGGIENARQLLLANDVLTAGIGNQHDQVGRYFMEHPHGRIARIDTPDPAGVWGLFRKRYPRDGPPLAPALVATEALQRSAEILNSAATFKPQRNPRHGLSLGKRAYMNLKHRLDPGRSGRRLWQTYRSVLNTLQRNVSIPVVRLGVKVARMELYLVARAEQAPNPDSRVLLSARRDALGCPLADLDWRLSAIDKYSVHQLALALGRQLETAGIGTLHASDWLEDGSTEWPLDPTVGNHPIGGYHHMGTTRMSANPARGVVDANCTVHGVANLHIAGSSVFTTSGWANPTLTLLALARRLARHLDTQLAKQ